MKLRSSEKVLHVRMPWWSGCSVLFPCFYTLFFCSVTFDWEVFGDPKLLLFTCCCGILCKVLQQSNTAIPACRWLTVPLGPMELRHKWHQFVQFVWNVTLTWDLPIALDHQRKEQFLSLLIQRCCDRSTHQNLLCISNNTWIICEYPKTCSSVCVSHMWSLAKC